MCVYLHEGFFDIYCNEGHYVSKFDVCSIFCYFIIIYLLILLYLFCSLCVMCQDLWISIGMQMCQYCVQLLDQADLELSVAWNFF